jgi:DNA-binding transcriptional LysR family regulator
MEMMMNSNQLWELDTRHLMALQAIASTRSVSKAAEQLGYGQSAVSQQLAALERIVGVRLVDRGTGPRPVTLTEAGETLLGHAVRILERIGCAQADLASLDAGLSGSIRIGSFQSAGSQLLPQVLSAFRTRWPEITIHLRGEEADCDLSSCVIDGSLDVSFLETSAIGVGLDHVEVFVDRFVAIVPPTHRLASRKLLGLSDFEGEDVIEGAAGDTCATKAIRAFQEAGIDTNVVFRTNDNTTRQRLVDAGLGCSVVPGLTVESSLARGGVVIPLKERIERRICLAWASNRTPSTAVLNFVETAKSALSAR